jgi:phage gp29-like protein
MENKLSDEIATRNRSINFYSLSTYLPDPDIVLRKQGKDVKVYKELLCDPHVFACIQSRKAGVMSLEWDINRGVDKDKNAELIVNVIKKLDINRLINDILDATMYGFQPIEIIWNKVNNLILPTELKAKPVEWFCFDDENKLKFRTKEHYFGEDLPPHKFLCPQSNPSYENPYGERTLSRVFWPVTFKKGGLKFWVVFTEKYGIPHLIGKHPRGASKEETDNLADLLEEMVQDAIAVIPDDSSVEIQEANKSSSAEIFEKLIDKMNAEISKAILGQTLTTEIGSTGSYAASNTHFAVRQDIIDSDKKLVEKTINQLLQWIYEINFASADVPVFEMFEEEDVDLNIAQRDKILSDTGVKFTKEYFLKTYGFDDEDLEIREDVIPIANSKFSQFQNEPQIEGQTQIDELFKFLSETDLSKQAQKMLSPLISLIESCNNYEEAKEILSDKNLHSKQFEQSLQKAMFLCELQGRSDALDE